MLTENEMPDDFYMFCSELCGSYANANDNFDVDFEDDETLNDFEDDEFIDEDFDDDEFEDDSDFSDDDFDFDDDEFD